MIEWIVWFMSDPVPYGLTLWVFGVGTGYSVGRQARQIRRRAH